MKTSSSSRLLYYDLGPGVTAFSSTRHGGVSCGNYASFNINGYCGDCVAHIQENLCLLAEELRIEPSCIILPHQVHGAEIRAITAGFFEMTVGERRRMLEGVDAVMTDVPEVCVGVSTADCIPVLLYDADARAVAAIHAGWRGTLQRVCSRVVRLFCDRYGASPDRVKAVVGPGISLGSFEVGQEVYDRFLAAGHDLSGVAVRYGKWHLDLPRINIRQLLDEGIHEENIHDSAICTYACAGDFFSARRLGIASGRVYTGILLR